VSFDSSRRKLLRDSIALGAVGVVSLPLLAEAASEESGKNAEKEPERKQGSEFKRYADILTEQHNRGREITDHVLAITNGPKISSAHAEPLAKVFESFVLMYQNHAAREDTIVFPAWKKSFSDKQLDEISDQFEDIERKMFG